MVTQSTGHIDATGRERSEPRLVAQLCRAAWMVLSGAVALALSCGLIMESVRQHIALLLPHLGRPARLGGHYLIYLPSSEAFARRFRVSGGILSGKSAWFARSASC